RRLVEKQQACRSSNPSIALQPDRVTAHRSGRHRPVHTDRRPTNYSSAGGDRRKLIPDPTAALRNLAHGSAFLPVRAPSRFKVADVTQRNKAGGAVEGR